MHHVKQGLYLLLISREHRIRIAQRGLCSSPPTIGRVRKCEGPIAAAAAKYVLTGAFIPGESGEKDGVALFADGLPVSINEEILAAHPCAKQIVLISSSRRGEQSSAYVSLRADAVAGVAPSPALEPPASAEMTLARFRKFAEVNAAKLPAKILTTVGHVELRYLPVGAIETKLSVTGAIAEAETALVLDSQELALYAAISAPTVMEIVRLRALGRMQGIGILGLGPETVPQYVATMALCGQVEDTLGFLRPRMAEVLSRCRHQGLFEGAPKLLAHESAFDRLTPTAAAMESAIKAIDAGERLALIREGVMAAIGEDYGRAAAVLVAQGQTSMKDLNLRLNASLAKNPETAPTSGDL